MSWCYETRENARTAAKACLRRMKTGGWKIRVWRNISWYWELRCGNLTVNRGVVGYNCYLRTNEGLGGASFWHDHQTYQDPNEAVREQLKKARKFVREVRGVVEDVENQLLGI